MVFDMYLILAMSSECERVFSSTKQLICDRQARLGDDIMEASECLKAWKQGGLLYVLFTPIDLIIIANCVLQSGKRRGRR